MTAFDAALFSAPSSGGYSAPAPPSAATGGGTGYPAPPLPPASNVDYGGSGGGGDPDSYGAPVYHEQGRDSYGPPVQRGLSSPSHSGFGLKADDIGNIDLTSGSGIALSSSRVSQDVTPLGQSE